MEEAYFKISLVLSLILMPKRKETNGSSTCNSKLLKVEILGIKIQRTQELGKCKSE
jgi:hypothetical protein